MKATSVIVNLTSENPERLKAFYTDTLGFAVEPGSGCLAVVPGFMLAIDGHDETRGMAREPQRVLIDFFVDDVKAEQERLKAAGVPFIRELGVEWWGGVISTFTDPDGNYGQIIQYDPGLATENPEGQAAAV
jgi:predicted enzyme related to lactoylglutathione lyase